MVYDSGQYLGYIQANTQFSANGVWSLNEVQQRRSDFNWPSPILDGLVMYLDGAKAASHPGTGNVWTDLASGSSFTVHNTTWTSDALGGVEFTSENTWGATNVGMNYDGGGFTLSVWIKHTGTVDTSKYHRYITVISAPAEGPVIRHDIATATSLHGYYFDADTDFIQINVTGQIVTDTYYNFVYTHDGSTFRLYNNNSEVGTNNTAITENTPSGVVLLSGQSTGDFFEGIMYIAQIYNRALSVAEINHNFQLYRGRFGI